MPGDLTESLSRFTPNGSGIDRDDWLFAAGRASVKPPRGWKWVAGLLAASQVVTLALWLTPRPAEVAPAATAVTPPPTDPVPFAPDSLGSLARSFDPDTPPPAAAADAVHATSVLTAGSRSVPD